MKLFKKKEDKEEIKKDKEKDKEKKWFKKTKKKKLSKRKKQKLREKEKLEYLKEKEERKNRKKINIDFNSIFGGMFVGISNIIPGISGGTMLVIFNLFDKLTYAVSDVFKRKTDTRKQSILLLAKVLISAAVGIIVFAKILGFTLKYYEAETIMCFMGLILFSVPVIIKEELKDEKFNIIFFIIGFALIIGLEYLNKNTFNNSTNSTMDLMHFLIMAGLGIIGGATMIFPGISGSMVMLVLGKYELVRGYIDSLTSFDKEAIISLFVFGIGVMIGIISSAKITNYLLKNHRSKTMSLILGFIIASALILPFNLETKIKFTTFKVCGIIIWFIIGGMVIYYINRLKTKE